MKMSKSKLLSLTLVTLSSLSLAACGNKAATLKDSDLKFSESTPKKPIKKGGTLTYALENNSPFTGIFLSELADTSPDIEAASPGQEGLFGADDHYKFNNKGAATIKLNHKDNSATIKIKNNVRWSDGKPLTAKDVEYSYEILANPKVQTTQYLSSFENIKGMAEYHQGKAKEISGIQMPDGPNGKVVILHFKELKPAMLNAGNGYFWEHAAPYHYLKDVPFEKLVSSDKVRKHPLFFGPYKMDKTVQGQSTSWSRNPYYWRGEPNFAHIQMSNINTSNVSQAIRSRKFDVAGVINSQYPQVKNTKGVNFIGKKSNQYGYVAFKVGKWDNKLGKNVEDPHAKMNNPALRKAMMYAMNSDVINERYFHRLKFRVRSLIPQQFGQYSDQSLPYYSYNLKKANELLDKAGYKKKGTYRVQPNGKKLVINLAVRASGSNAEAVWTNYIQQWKKVGLNVKFVGGRPMEFNHWVDAVKASDPKIDVLEGGWEPAGDPSPAPFYGERMPYNFSRFVSPQNNKLLEEIDSQKAFDQKYRVKKMHEWQKWMYKNAYVVPVSGFYDVQALNKNITGWSYRPSANVWYEAGFAK
ncbi:oligopeptide ABC transporter substrate-binding protein [uncultured Lactobacillus sp.]|uniref:oligopeptide ABC transporter substrate-binding protein n=1 Tax=uncultured Lactobacillus sp. TaxID=153152 RepID=UPI00263138EE|nr:oligopeptide ABC transporter substrate-binding protein [uncultured Lactobacillus sp.]